MGWSDVGFHSKTIDTPNLVKLAKQSTELSRFYTYPLCSPTRAALLTGNSPRRVSIFSALGPRQQGLPSGTTTLPSILSKEGYKTSLVGKWHLGKANTPQTAGFDRFYGFLNAEVNYFKHTGQTGNIDWQRDGKTINEEGYSTYLLANEASSQIKSRDKSKPFYLQLNFNAPHFPLSAPDELIQKNSSKGTKLGLYHAVIEALDQGIGQVMNAIETENIQNDTVVIFFSDNGGSRREGGNNLPWTAGKGTAYEGGIHTPALIRWPNHIREGNILAQPIQVEDLFPTLAEMAGIQSSRLPNSDGKSQLNSILNAKPFPRQPLYIGSVDSIIIDGDWKYVEFLEGNKALYNLKSDPSERTNLMNSQSEVATRLASELKKRTNGMPPLPSTRPIGG